MKKFKKALSIIIAVLMLVSALPVMAVSADSVVLKETIAISEDESVILPLTVEESGYYRIYSTGEFDTYCDLLRYDSSYDDYEELAYFEDYSEAQLNFDMKWYLEAGEQYELEVEVYSENEASFQVIVEPADFFVTEVKLTKMPDVDFIIEGFEYDSFWVEGIELEATLSDGTKTEYVYDPAAFPDNILGSVLTFDAYSIDEGYFEIYCDDAYAKVEMNVVENPVESIEYTGAPLVVEENVDGELYEDVFYYYYDFSDEDTFKVYYKDGTSEEININERVYDYEPGMYPVYYYDDQFETPWTADKDNVVTLEYLGFYAEVPVEIVPEGSLPDNGDDGNDDPDYILPTIGEEAEIIEVTVNYEEPTTVEFTPDASGYYQIYSTGEYDTYGLLKDAEDWWYGADNGLNEEDENFFLKSYLEAGETYILEISVFENGERVFDVVMEPAEKYVTDIELVKVPDINYVYEGAVIDSFFPEGMELEFTFSDGSKEQKRIEALDDIYSRICGSKMDMTFCNDEYNDEYIEITCDEGEEDYYLNIIENPVDRIEYNGYPFEIYEGTNGYYDDMDEQFYYTEMEFSDSDTVTVYYKDGTSEEININERLYVYKHGLYPLYTYDDQYEEPWTAGGEYVMYIGYLGCEAEVPVKILADSDVPVDGEYMIGDANSDEKINVKDATAIQKAIASLITLDATQEAAADADSNGIVNIKDATAIQKFSAGIDTGFLIGEINDGSTESGDDSENLTEYYSTAGLFSTGYIPCLSLNDDGTFTFLENLAEGMGTYEGTYQMSEDELQLSVTSCSFSGFTGAGVELIEFTINDQNTLTLNTNLCMSRQGHIFSSEETENDQEEELIPDAYNDIIEKYIEAFPWNDDDDVIVPGLDDASYLYRYYSSLSEIGYAFIDVDNNGTEELLIGEVGDESCYIFDMYTLSDGEAIHLFDGGERYRHRLRTDGSIINNWSSSAFTSGTDKYILNDSGDELEFQQRVVYDAWYALDQGWIDDVNGDNISEKCYFVSDSETDQSQYVNISSDEAKTMIDDMNNENNFVNINYIPLSEYKYDTEDLAIWKDLYIDVINNNSQIYRYYSLVYIDSDDIPELYIHAGSTPGDIVYSVMDNELVQVTCCSGVLYYLEKEGTFCVDGRTNVNVNQTEKPKADCYQLNKGEFVEIDEKDFDWNKSIYSDALPIECALEDIVNWQ